MGVRVRRLWVAAPESGKATIFRANAKFIRQKSAAKNENRYLLKPKNGIHSVQQGEVPEIRDFC